ncbi:MAG: HAMP domain-containing histidine kinase [Spirochaetaceae bacterium]|nr:MAG: HAMP domain-containing histidine kinase [Spirochaetaceae bacterium]
MNSYELSPQPAKTTKPYNASGLDKQVLLRNAFWFMTFRWIVVAVFVTVGLLGRFLAGLLLSKGLAIPYWGLWILAGVLSATNLIFFFFARSLKSESSVSLIKTNLWLQIVSDLIVVTFLVHMIGSTYTFIPFTYLFHITLSCIFFPKRESLLVTVIAGLFYCTSVVVEITGIWAAPGILVAGIGIFDDAPTLRIVFALSAVFVWFVEWYLVSSLSEAVRIRDQRLSIANEQLIEADEEKTRQVLLTTHDLKAPFAGIESNIQVMKHQHWDMLNQEVKSIIERIDQRAQTLRERIRDILILGDLRSRGVKEFALELVDLKKCVDGVVAELSERAQSRGVRVKLSVPDIKVQSNAEQLAILCSNLVSNAIYYSYEGGEVTVASEADNGTVCLSVSDQGIGIKEEALPHIFEEYYRTKEAARFNRNSTGLGLSIVREIAQNLNLRVRVESEVGEGTTFRIYIPLHRER